MGEIAGFASLGVMMVLNLILGAYSFGKLTGKVESMSKNVTELSNHMSHNLDRVDTDMGKLHERIDKETDKLNGRIRELETKS